MGTGPVSAGGTSDQVKMAKRKKNEERVSCPPPHRVTPITQHTLNNGCEFHIEIMCHVPTVTERFTCYQEFPHKPTKAEAKCSLARDNRVCTANTQIRSKLCNNFLHNFLHKCVDQPSACMRDVTGRRLLLTAGSQLEQLPGGSSSSSSSQSLGKRD